MKAEEQRKNQGKRIEQMSREGLLKIHHQQRLAVLIESMSMVLFVSIGGYLVISKRYCMLDYPLYLFYGVMCVVIMGLLFQRERQVHGLLKEEISMKGEGFKLEEDPRRGKRRKRRKGDGNHHRQ